jgi:DNA modification methylase
MPESVRDRCTKAHEYVFLLAKSPRYYFDHVAIQEPASGRSTGNKSHKYTAEYEHGNEFHRTAAGLLASADKKHTVRNKRDVWTIAAKPFKGAHFATFPPQLVEPCILAGSPVGGTVLDPFAGSGTKLEVALKLGRNAIGIEINPEYVELAKQRISQHEASYSLAV